MLLQRTVLSLALTLRVTLKMLYFHANNHFTRKVGNLLKKTNFFQQFFAAKSVLEGKLELIKIPEKGYGVPRGIADGRRKVSLRCQAPFLGLGGWEQLRAKAHGKATPRRGC